MKRLLLFLWATDAGGGIQERRANLASEWRSRGYDVIFATRLSPQQQVRAISSFECHYLQPEKGNSITKLFRLVLNLSKLLRGNDFDAVLASGPRSIFICALSLFLAQSSTRLYGSVHNSLRMGERSFMSVRTWVNALFLILSSHRLSGIVGVSNGVSNQLRSLLRWSRVPITTIYNPVPPPKNVIEDINIERACITRRGEYLTVVAVGRLARQKGFDYLLRAIPLIKDNVRFKIIGDGPEKAALLSMAETLGVSDRVEFLGYRNDVDALICSGDGFVLSSRWEGFGTVLVEALRAQVPIVSFDCDHGPREILVDGRYGVLVPTGDVDGFAKAINSHINGDRSPNSRWQDFDISVVSQKYLSLMDIK